MNAEIADVYAIGKALAQHLVTIDHASEGVKFVL